MQIKKNYHSPGLCKAIKPILLYRLGNRVLKATLITYKGSRVRIVFNPKISEYTPLTVACIEYVCTELHSWDVEKMEGTKRACGLNTLLLAYGSELISNPEEELQVSSHKAECMKGKN
jgi:hypothetical protein